MKTKIYFLAIAMLLTNLSFGQATLEHSYSTTNFAKFNAENESYAFKTQNGINYFRFDYLNNNMNVYNENHICFPSKINSIAQLFV